MNNQPESWRDLLNNMAPLAACELTQSHCLTQLMSEKTETTKKQFNRCSNPLCQKLLGTVSRRRPQYSSGWHEVRTALQAEAPLPAEVNLGYHPIAFYCKRCLDSSYCGRACQLLHWREHRITCIEAID